MEKIATKHRLVLLATLMSVAIMVCAAGKILIAEAKDEPAGVGLGDHAASKLRPAGVQITVDEIVASGFTQPVHITHAGDGSGRLFVVEQPGQIKVIRDGVVEAFLDISNTVLSGGERGLLSMAFPPNYASRGHFYVNYTRQPDGATVVARYAVTFDPDVADPSSEEVVLVVPQPYSNHNGGQIAFGPGDGFLYVGMGDGGSGGDPQNYAQNPSELLGKMLRFDVETGDPLTYTMPASNPFTQTVGYRAEIWVLGLRNPWRFSFDRDTHDLYIGDVGQNAWEEIDYQDADTPGGLNYGWRCREGTHTYNTLPPCDDPDWLATLTDPIAEYNHAEGRSVTGGFVYRGRDYPTLVGLYFFADYVEGKIWSMDTRTAVGARVDAGHRYGDQLLWGGRSRRALRRRSRRHHPASGRCQRPRAGSIRLYQEAPLL